jgi:hypothetical protein
MAEYLMFETDRCANGLCTNRFGEGKWVMWTAPAIVVGTTELKGLLISMCAPCATRHSHETTPPVTTHG